jgi:hypothetical protein
MSILSALLDSECWTNEEDAAELLVLSIMVEDIFQRNAEDGDLGQQGEPGWHGCLAMTNSEPEVEPNDGAARGAQNLNRV